MQILLAELLCGVSNLVQSKLACRRQQLAVRWMLIHGTEEVVSPSAAADHAGSLVSELRKMRLCRRRGEKPGR